MRISVLGEKPGVVVTLATQKDGFAFTEPIQTDPGYFG
jgi:hypothetical protein